MSQLGDLHPGAGDRNGATFLQALEEPLLDWVVVERPVDVHRSNRSPGSSFALQESLCVQLAFVSALGVHSVNLPKKPHNYDTGLPAAICNWLRESITNTPTECTRQQHNITKL